MTLQSVAEEVGVRKPSVLHHFPSKEAIRQAVLADFWEHWSHVVPRLLQGAMEHTNGFEKMIGELVAFFREDPDRARLIIRETLDSPQEFRRLFRAYVMPWLVTIGNNIRDGQQRGMCHAELDPEQHLLQILELILISTAWGDLVADGPASAPHESTRHIETLMRIARTSLFTERLPRSGPSRRRSRGKRS
jgi:AcrR family transcriptional regulator